MYYEYAGGLCSTLPGLKSSCLGQNKEKIPINMDPKILITRPSAHMTVF